MIVLFSTLLYALGKELGLDNAVAEWNRQCAEPDGDSLPAARLLERVRVACSDILLQRKLAGLPDDVVDLHGYCDVGSTHIGKARSRAFHVACEVGAEFWVSCDDDVEASQTAVSAMLRVASIQTPRIVFLPCYLRDKPIVGVKFSPVAMSVAPDDLRAIDHAATCCFVANGAALRALKRNYETALAWRDDADQKTKVALFLEMFDGNTPTDAARTWWGEDFAFCKRAALCGVELVALLAGHSSHAGHVLELSSLRGALS